LHLAATKDDSMAEKMAWQRVGLTDGYWAGRKGGLRAVQTGSPTVEKLAYPQVGSWGAHLAAQTGDCLADCLVALTVGCWAGSSGEHWAVSSDVLMAGCWAWLRAAKTVLHLVGRTAAH